MLSRLMPQRVLIHVARTGMANSKEPYRHSTSCVGWDVIPHTPFFQPSKAHAKAVCEYPTENGPADYALFVNGRILGIVEAKKLSLGPQNVLVQAQRYSEGATSNPFQFGECRVPFLYSTNGEVVWFHDVRSPLERSRRVGDYPTPAGLEERLGRDFDGDVQKLLALSNNHPRLRPYQIEANEAVEKAIADRKRPGSTSRSFKMA